MLVFLAGIAPKEYLHTLFFDHHDTDEPVLDRDDIVIGKKHAHCSFLSFEFAPFIAGERQTFTFEEKLEHEASYLFPFYHCYYAHSSHTISLRGPPTATAV